MEQFVSGWKRNYYGKGDVIVYRLNRDGQVPSGQSPVFGANVLMLLYGDAFWPTYTTGDNSGLIATDSMKNFIQRETMNFPGSDLEPVGVAVVSEKATGREFWRGPKGIAILAGLGGAALLAFAAGGGNDEPTASPSSP